jgi:hypothetical protein
MVPWRLRGDQSFPFARPIEIEKTLDVDITGVLKRLSIAGDGTSWGAYLRNAPLRLTSDDVSKLKSAARSHKAADPVVDLVDPV